MLRPDPVLNVVNRLKRLGFDPRRVADDCWVARCPLCGGARALTVSRASLVVCRNPDCRDYRILQTIGMPGRDAYNPTHPAVIRELNALPVNPFEGDLIPMHAPAALEEPSVEIRKSVPSAAARAHATNVESPPAHGQVSEPDSDAAPAHATEGESAPAHDQVSEPASDTASALSMEIDSPSPALPHDSTAESKRSGAPGPGPNHTVALATGLTLERDRIVVVEALLYQEEGFVADSTDAGVDRMSQRELVPSTDAEAKTHAAAETIASLAATARTLRGSDGHYYAALPVGERCEFYRLDSAELRRALSRLHAQSTGRYPARTAVATEVAALHARAENADRIDPVFLRIARDPSGTAYLLDLGDSARRAVKISAHGWEVVESHGVNFWRPPGQRALPMPERGGSLDRLRRFANVSVPMWPLLIGWLTSALRPVGPYPVLVLSGEQGSAKTTLARVCRLLIDPAAGPLRTPPKSERDIMVGAQNNWLQVFDNLGSLAPWQSDAFCRLSSGGAFATRGLFTDDREFVIEAQRPIMLNGIADFVRHADLADRSVFLWMEPMPESRRRGDMAIWEEFGQEHGRLLGALLNAVAGGIRLWPEVRLKAMTRMADFDRWGEAVMCGLGFRAGTFVETYRANRRSACEQALEESPVVVALHHRPAAPRRLELLAHGPLGDSQRSQTRARDRGNRMAQDALGTLPPATPAGTAASRYRSGFRDQPRAHRENYHRFLVQRQNSQ